MVNLRKPVREYTPVHIRDEYTPEVTSDQKVQTPKAIEVVTPSISYSQLASRNGRSHLASVFRKATPSEMAKLESMRGAIEKTLKRDKLLRRISFMGGALAAITLVATINLAFLLSNLLPWIISIGVAADFLLIIATGIVGSFISNCGHIDRALSTASDIFISKSGADSFDTHYSIVKGDQGISHELFLPYHCKDKDAFYEVTHDKHNVFIVYSSKYNAAVIVDPNLFI